MSDTPIRGYNSDPCIFRDNDTLYVFWRECGTSICESLGAYNTIVGVTTQDGCNFSDKKIYLKNTWKGGDLVQAPTIIKRNGIYYFYATWYQYEPERKSKGIAIWKGTSLTQPDFELMDTVPFPTLRLCDKKAEIRIRGHHFYLPAVKHFDLWHFDLFEYEGKLYMIACQEKDDNIILAVAEDYVHFRPMRKPLVNNHYMENHCGYRQYYYKPTAFVKDDTLHCFWTCNDKEDGNHNVLWHSVLPMRNIK